MLFYNNAPLPANKAQVRALIYNALREDEAFKDITTRTFIPKEEIAHGAIIAKESGVLAGINIACEAFKALDRDFKAELIKEDGQALKKGDIILRFSGKASAILSGERVALNFLQHLSGIATIVSRFVEELRGTETKLLDTRKTIPGLRALEKYAVQTGGGTNHRLNLADIVLVKDNHLALSEATLGRAIKAIRKKYPTIKIEVEAHSLTAAKRISTFDIDVIMLDNMKLADMRKAVCFVRKANPNILLEASGNITLQKVRKVARCGVDYISVGMITHSPRALDLSLQLHS